MKGSKVPTMAKTNSKSTQSKSAGSVAKPAKTAKDQPKKATPHARTEKVTMEAAQKKAKELGLLLDGLTEMENIIRAIQIAEGYQSCFGSQLVETCGQTGCCWRENCRVYIQL